MLLMVVLLSEDFKLPLIITFELSMKNRIECNTLNLLFLLECSYYGQILKVIFLLHFRDGNIVLKINIVVCSYYNCVILAPSIGISYWVISFEVSYQNFKTGFLSAKNECIVLLMSWNRQSHFSRGMRSCFLADSSCFNDIYIFLANLKLILIKEEYLRL